jgi:hypothetical protein
MIIQIQPVPCFPKTATQLRIDDGIVDLGKGANFQWALLDADGAIVSGPSRVPLTAEQYEAWGADDGAIATACAANLGLTPVPADAATPTA